MSSQSSENINELAAALSKAQRELRSAPKDSVNPFFKSKYASLGSCWDTARECLTKNGLSVIQKTAYVDSELSLITKLIHESGQWESCAIPLYPKDKSMQSIGAAASYARRYGLCMIVGIDADEDVDGNDTQPEKGSHAQKIINPTARKEEVSKEPKLSKDEYMILLDLMEKADADLVKSINVQLKAQGYPSLVDSPKSKFEPLKRILEGSIKEKEKANES